jgi:LmbE family N-acetylglucosaminyl deacetylase
MTAGARRRTAPLRHVFAALALALPHASGYADEAGRPALEVPQKTHLLVIAPHPDDETLGAAGLMQRVKKLGGRVSVGYLTSGDGYVDGVELETRRPKPRPEDFVDYGEMRLGEALRALQAMSVRPKRLLVFGFPDGGLADLLTTYWSAKDPFRSPYTRDDRSPYPGSVDAEATYFGVSLERALARVITQQNPTWIAVTAPWDIHPDHCAAFHFVVRALRRLAASNPEFANVKVLAYTVHRPDWPGIHEGKPLDPPPAVSPDGAAWKYLEMTSDELDGKGRALDAYASQMDIMAILLRPPERSVRGVPDRAGRARRCLRPARSGADGSGEGGDGRSASGAGARRRRAALTGPLRIG